MDVYSLEDIKIVRDCIAIEIKKIQSDPNLDKVTVQHKINEYTFLFHDLIKNAENAQSILQNQTNDLKEFCQYILSTPKKDLLVQYTETTKLAMIQSNTFSQEKFDKFKETFWNGFKELNSENNFEEEPEAEIPSIHLTDYMKANSEMLDELLKNNKQQNLSPHQFKNFSLKFKETTKLLGISKFQQYFDQLNKKIFDMYISYDNSDAAKLLYKTDFTLLEHDSTQSHLSLTETIPGLPELSDFYQNLCFSYLEADKFSKIDENKLNNEIIRNQMNIFSKCNKKLKEMLNWKINLTPDNRVIFSYESCYSTELCNTQELDDNSIEI